MGVEELDSIRLIKLCAKDMDNHAAWQELLSRFSEKIKTYLARYCFHARGRSPYLSSQIALIPQQEMEDLIQQVWLRILDKDCWLLKQFRGTEEELWTCLAFVARCVVCDHYRDLRRKKRPPLVCSLDSLAEAGSERSPAESAPAPAASNPEEALLREEVIGQIYTTLRHQLSSAEDLDKAIVVFDLYFRQGYTAEEISRYGGINLSRPGVSRIIVTLKCCLRQYAKVHSLKR